MKKSLLLTGFLLALCSFAFSQSNPYWTIHNQAGRITTDKAVTRLSFPSEFKLFDLDIDPLKRALFSIAGNRSGRLSTIITLPNAAGELEQFEVSEASNFENDLQARFPEIRAFSGKGITDRFATLKLSISPQGIQTMVFRTEKENEFIEAYSSDHMVYAVFKSQRKPGQLPWTCSTQEMNLSNDIAGQVAHSNITSRSGGDLKTMRLAQSCNGEYSNYFGATSAAQVALVLAAFNATLTRCNGVYEKDLALHLNLISATTNVIYYDPVTDPYTTLSSWNGQLQSTLTSIIGEANYDIGHMFGASGGGGNAGCIGCVCTDGSKGSGITSPADGIPQGDNFDIDYVVHEVGHQLGGNHTFSHNLEGSGVNKEVGSGITIMGYAGITSQDVAPHSIDIYHEATIAQIQANLATKTCPVTTNISANNATPVVGALSSYTIPISTPFALTGSATDANPGDALTYCWEQNDNASTSGANSVASPTKTTGPNWLSFSPSSSPNRYFPQLSTILAGGLTTGPLPGGDAGVNIEALSSVSRTLSFRLTVRDNCPFSSNPPVKVGQTSFSDMTVTVTNTSGPFAVTSPNTGLSWAGSSSQTITWSVANTTLAPVSCANVKISLSTDGGQTFPTVLAASTPNDGSEVLTIPNLASTTARIKIESVGNIFFDISNTNFIITAAPTAFTFNSTTPTTLACNGPSTAAVTLGTTSIGGFSTPIDLTATSGVPAGATVSFSPTPVTPGNSTIVTLNNANTLSNGTYNITITGTAGSNIQTTIVTYIISAGTGPSISSQPVNSTVCSGNAASFSVTATLVTGYQWQLNSGTGFTDISGANAATYSIASPTTSQNGYQYRCVLTNQCGSTTSSAATLTVNAATAITTQPVSISVCPGSNATFTVTATGTSLSYQWRKGGVNISGANAASFSITAASAGDAANYDVVVSGTCGTITSNMVALTLNTTTVISTQPVSQTICAGTSVTFTVVATGTSLSYQWRKGGVNISVATAASYTLVSPATSDAGNYDVVVTGICGTVTSVTVTLTVNASTIITTQPSSLSVCAGSNATFTVTATGTSLTYQWRKAGVNISGANSSSFTITGVSAGDAANYDVVVTGTGTCGTATSNIATLSINAITTINTQPVSQAACAATSVTFTVGASGASLTYQWRKGGINISGANSASYTIASLTSPDAGNYDVIVTGSCGTVTSNTVSLTINPLPSVTVSPNSANYCITGPAVTLTANGASTYAWSPSTGLSATTGASVNASPSASQNYTVTGTGANGCLGAATAVITAISYPSNVTASASPATICSGGSSTLTGSASFPFTAKQFLFSTGTGSSLDPMTGATTVVSASTDDAPMNTSSGANTTSGPSVGLPFTFYFEGVPYNFFSASPDGWIVLKNTNAAATLEYTNVATSANNVPRIYPYWDDLATGTTGSVKTVTTGTAPNRIFIVQWNVVIPWNTSGAPNSTFQAWLYENSNKIEYRYGTMGTATGTVSCGVTGTTATNYNVITFSSNTASNSTTNDTQVAGVLPASGRIYTFNPPFSTSFSWAATTNLVSPNSQVTSTTALTSSETFTLTASNSGCTSTATTTVAIGTVTAITAQPVSQTVCTGTSVTLTVGATGSSLTYQWRKAGINISGANSATYTIPNPVITDAGNYDVVVTGTCGTVTSGTATLTVNASITITSQPANLTVCAGSNATFTVAATGTSLTYQWRKAGVNIIGANASAFTITGALAGDASNYDVVVTGSGTCGTITSNAAILNVNPAPTVPVITPSSSTICAGNSQSLAATGGTTGGTASFTLGTATTLTSQTQQPTAFCNRWAQYWNQTIYTAAELLSAGLTAGTSITSITYNITSLGDASNNTNFSIRIGTTANSTFTAFITSGLNVVYGPSSYTHAIGFNTINFTTPYTWNGTSNIVIDVRQDGIDALNNSITYYTAASSNMNIEAHTSTSSGTTSLLSLVASSSVTSNLTVRRLNIVLGYSSLQNPTWAWSPSTGLSSTSDATVIASPSATTSYTVTGTNSFGCSKSTTTIVNVNLLPIVGYSGLAPVYCTTDAAVNLTGSPSGGTFSGPGVLGNTFNPAVAGAGSFTITYSLTNVNGCTNTATQQVTVNICNTLTALNLKVFFEGAYLGNGLMRATLFDLGLHADPTATDSITINLWAVNDLTNSTPTYSVRALIHTNGTASMNFPSMVNGNSFYIAVRQRNHIETWSKLPVLFSTTTSYDFSTVLNMAYDDGVNPPMQNMGTEYALWAGEITGDGAIDGQDMNEIDNTVGSFSYDISDVNGDGATDGQDMNYVDNNSLLGLFIARP